MKTSKNRPLSTIALLATVAASLTAATTFAQSDQNRAPSGDPAVAQQLAAAQDKASQLKGTLAQNTSPSVSKSGSMGAMPSPGMSAGGGMNMGGMQAGGGMKMQGGSMSGGSMGGGEMTDDDMMMGGSMSGGANMSGMSSMMGMHKNKMAKMMGHMGSMGPSALPGFPGASHLYHIGATDFFLDHASHIGLTIDQQVQLAKMREQAAMAKNASDRKIQQAEEELWQLTASDKPDISKIDAKVREIEKLTGDARIAFIRAVGDAAKLLNDDQRKILTGFGTPALMSGGMNMAPGASPSPTPDQMSHM